MKSFQLGVVQTKIRGIKVSGNISTFIQNIVTLAESVRVRILTLDQAPA